jgi:ribonucleotide reductase alpha subunit
MIKTIIKRNKTEQEFSAEKLNGWGIWASENLGHYVSWSDVVLSTVSTLPEKCTSIELQNRLIKVCLDMDSYSYQKMAGRLYSALLDKIIFPNGLPTVQELHKKLLKRGLMIKLKYSDSEYEKIEHIIKHKRNMQYTHGQIHQIREKYSLKNRVGKKEYETSQFVYMRMAMALAETQPIETRLEDIKQWYDHFSEGRINCPTPNYVNLGTSHRGYASCCLHSAADNAASLAINDHISYTMTYMNAGIGTHLNIRSIGDPVKNGMISHQGKLPYYRAMVGAVTAQMQNGRGGACTTHYNLFDPEVEVINKLKNPKSTEDKKIRGMDYSAGSNIFFAKKAAKNEEVFTFNSFTAPDLYELLYSGDSKKFEELYNEYENNKKFKKNYVNAREVLLTVLNEGFETGRAYLHFLDAMNTHTPFNDNLYMSNLCFTGETLVATADGRNAVSIKELADESNGKIKFNVYSARYNKIQKKWVSEIKPAVAFKSGYKHTIELTLSDGSTFKCTPDHKLALENGEYLEAEKCVGVELKSFYTSLGTSRHINGMSKITVVSMEDSRMKDVYDLTVEDNHNFNIITSTQNNDYLQCSGILVHNCQEVVIPVEPYQDMRDLYSTEDHGRGEIGLCSLAAACPSNIKSEEEYASVAYYCLLMIDKCIHLTEYALPHLEITAKARMSAGVGIVGLSHYLAINKQKYTTSEGKQFLHDTAERHYWHLLNASLRLGKELGNAKWMHKTKWIDGWTPLDTYNKNVNNVVSTDIHYDWKGLSQQIIDNGGIRNSVLACEMPVESCLHKDQKIKTEKGLLTMLEIFELSGVSLNEAIKNHEPIIGGSWYDLPKPLKVNTRSGYKSVNRVWYNGYVNYLNLTLENGKTIKCTHNHKFLVNRNGTQEWIKAIDLNENDDIISHSSEECSINKKITKIEVNEMKDHFFDIEVDDVHEYILDNNCVVHNSSKANGLPNGLYPIRDLTLIKTDNSTVIYWAAKDGEKLKNHYEIAWDIPTKDLIDMYAIVQKWTDQGISADLYRKITGDDVVGSSEMLSDYFYMVKMGLKSRYYQNSMTSEGVELVIEESCTNGVCKL